ncbi:MAG TPA: hypothetical protein VMA74_20695 [Dyella sp.]|uniref:hypothetical protein n=1 Tax=Dyella sp. TaxID=1869338 RepID=UPI002C1C3D57|nr:hypothetical protein [Dyella sp.]HUB92155.1 hypothetical protein [Dyella sp.]
MRHVIYTEDMQPITVFSLQTWAEKMLHDHQYLMLVVMPPIAPVCYKAADPELSIRTWTVRIRAKWLVKDGQRHMLLFTGDEETALLLESAFLPGQQRTLNDERQQAFISGLFTALGY